MIKSPPQGVPSVPQKNLFLIGKLNVNIIQLRIIHYHFRDAKITLIIPVA